MTSTSEVKKPFKPTHPIVLVVPSLNFSEFGVKEAVNMIKILTAMRISKNECDVVTVSECK